MAEHVDVVEKIFRRRSRVLICHDHYTEPKVLPCLHYYCKQCVHRLTLRTGLNQPFSCPECCKDTTLPRGNVDELPTAFFVNHMKSVHSKLERAHSKVEAKCEMCSVFVDSVETGWKKTRNQYLPPITFLRLHQGH